MTYCFANSLRGVLSEEEAKDSPVCALVTQWKRSLQLVSHIWIYTWRNVVKRVEDNLFFLLMGMSCVIVLPISQTCASREPAHGTNGYMSHHVPDRACTAHASMISWRGHTLCTPVRFPWL